MTDFPAQRVNDAEAWPQQLVVREIGDQIERPGAGFAQRFNQFRV